LELKGCVAQVYAEDKRIIKGTFAGGRSTEGRGMVMFGQREQKGLEEQAEWVKFQREGGSKP